MPRCNVALKAIYRDKLHRLSFQHNMVNVGSATIKPNDGYTFYSSNGSYYSRIAEVTLPLNESAGSCRYTYFIYNHTAVLTDTITDPEAYRIKSITAYNTANAVSKDKDGNITNEPIEGVVQKNEDGTYTITQPDSNCLIYVEYEPNVDNFNKLTLTTSSISTDKAVPQVTVTGKFEGIGAVSSISTPYKSYSNGESVDRKLLQGADATLTLDCLSTNFMYTPMTITVTNSVGDVIETAEYCNGEHSYVNGTFFKGEPEITYSLNKTGFKANFKFTMPDEEITINVKVKETYTHFIVNQYKVDGLGNKELVSESENFTTDITAALPIGGQTEASYPAPYHKFFTQSSVLGLEPYTQQFTVNGGTDTRSYITISNTFLNQIAAKPNPASGYVLSKIEAVSLNRDNELLNTYTPAYYASKDGMENTYFYSNGGNRSAKLVLNVYYAKESRITVNQVINAFLDTTSNERMGEVTISDYNKENRSDVFPFVLDTGELYNTRTYIAYSSDNSANHIIDSVNNIHTWSNECGVTPNTGIEVTVTPRGIRNIIRFTPYVMNGEEKQELAYTLVSGTGLPETQTVYRITDLVAPDQHIYVEVEYGQAQTLTVQVKMLDEQNNAVENTTNTKVTVKGALTTAGGTNTEKPFRRNYTDTEYFDTIETTTKDTVFTFSNTHLDINTELDSDSGYVIANVAAYEADASGNPSTNINLAPDKVERPDFESAALDYRHCEMSSLPVSKNAVIIVYLAKTSTMTVSVYTANDAGEYSPGNGTGSDNSYVNVLGENALIGYNPQTVITKLDEGNFNTSSFTVTNNPSTRTTQILQGSVINAFAQLPGEDYIISKIIVKYEENGETIVDNSAYFGSTYIFTDPISDEKFVRTNFGTNARILPSRDDYTVDIYLARAQDIYSRAIGHDLDGYVRRGGGGTLNVESKCITDPEVLNPLTVISPNGTRNNAVSSYNGNGSTYSGSFVPTHAKCMQGSNISLKVTPNKGYMIKSVNAYMNKFDGEEIALKASEASSDGTVIYTLVKEDGTPYLMGVFTDVYVDVQFDEIPKDSEIKWNKLHLDITYTDDFETFKPITDESTIMNSISATNDHFFLKNQHLLKDQTGGLFTEKYLENGQQYYDYEVKTLVYDGVAYNTWFELSGDYGGKDYIPYSIVLKDGDGNVVSVSDHYFSNSYSVNCKIEGDKEYYLEVKLMPVGRINIKQYENNCYGDLEGVPQTSQYTLSSYGFNFFGERVDLTAENPHVSNPVTYASLGSMSSYRTGFYAEPKSSEYFIVKDSTVSFKVYTKAPKPGELVKVAILKDWVEVEDAVEFIGEKNGVNEYKVTFTTEANKTYTVVTEYDCIDFWTLTNESRWNGYLIWSDKPASEIDFDDPSTYTHKLKVNKMGEGNGVITRLSKEYADLKGQVYFITEQNVPQTTMFLTNVTYNDFKDTNLESSGVNLTETMKAQTFQREVDGLTKYYYWCQLKPENEPDTVLDNSMSLSVYFQWESSIPVPPDPTPPDPEKDCQFTVTQYERTSNSGFVETTKGNTEVTLSSGDQFRYGDENVDSFSLPADLGSGVLSSTATGITKQGQTAVLTVTPPEKYIVSKIEVEESSGRKYTYDRNESNIYDIYLNRGIMRINVYYSQPLVTISTNNTADLQKGSVDIDGNTIITSSQFMNSTLVNAGDSKKVVIKPLTYDDSEGNTQKYHVAYILMGNSRNSMLLMDPSTYTVDEETGEITIELNNISDDVDMHIQLEGEVIDKTSLLIVSHHIKIGDEYEDSTYGKVLTTGTLEGKDTPITLMDGTPCSQFELTTDSSITSTVINGTTLDFDVTPPENFEVEKIEGRFASATDADYSENLTFTKDGSKYTLDNAMPDSGVVFVDVYYNTETFKITYDGNGNTAGEAPTDAKEYVKNEQATVLGKNTLEKENYKFLGWSKDQNSTTAQYTEGDEITMTEDVTLYAVWEEMPKAKLVYNYIDRFGMNKQYVVVTYLTQEEADNGNKPSTATINKNAPFITDLFKSCTWDAENAVTADGVTNISAIQKNYTYKIYFSAGTPADNETIYDSGSVLAGSRYVEKRFNELFDITADKEADGVPFKYWVASDVDENGNIIAGTEKIVCYTERYGYRVTKNLSIRPVYEESTKDWAVTIGKPLYSREQSTDEDGNNKKDYVYSDYLISIFQPENRMLADLAANNQNVQFGVILDSDTSITYDGTGEVQYPGIDVDTVKDVIISNAPQSGQTVTTSRNGHRYYMYDRTTQAVTNKNRCDFYIRFANTLKNESTVFNVYAYVIVDGEIYISNAETLNIYDCGKAEYTAE